jgi:hypothetical protein
VVAAGDDLAALPDDDESNAPDEPQKMQPKDDDQLHRALEILKSKKPS